MAVFSSTTAAALLVASLLASVAEEEGTESALETPSSSDAELFFEPLQDAAFGEPDKLQIYGYLDTGLQWLKVPQSSFLSGIVPSKANTFVLGNLNVFLDAAPDESWRVLMEVRFTNNPHGAEMSYGSPTTEYERIDNTHFDLGSVSGNNVATLGAIIIERAWLEWSGYDWLKVKVGSWLTPYGIWNVDHGTPTLISMLLPESQKSQFFPNRQIGVQASGLLPVSSIDLSYHLWAANGRTVTQFDLSHDKAVGGRLVGGLRTGTTRAAFGMSGYYGTWSDFEKNITSFSPFKVERTTLVKAKEWAAAADLSVDIADFRVRGEVVMLRRMFAKGKRPASMMGPPGSNEPDRYEWNAYILVAYDTGLMGIEPFVWGEVIHRPTYVGDTAFVPSVGLNVRFAPAVHLKTQVAHALFRNMVLDAERPASENDFLVAAARLVIAF